MNQYDPFKVSNVAQYIVLMDVVILKLCTLINCLLIKLVHTPHDHHIENKIMECACCIVHHLNTMAVIVTKEADKTFPNQDRREEAQDLSVSIMRVTLHSL